MSNRIVSIVLRGDVKGFIGPMTAAEASASNLHKRMIANTKEAESYRQNLTALGNTAGKFGLVAAAGVGLAVRAFANFDEAMSAVAATGDDAKQSIDGLRDAAIDAGARTKFSATEAAEAIENLAKAGVSASDILGGGLDGALDLAAAGGLGVAEAAEIAATAMNQFKLSGEDVPHIADLLAAAAGKAMGEVSDMGAAFKYVGPVAQQLGISIEETAGTIALLAQNGVLGDQAGTSLRGMLTSLTSPSKIAATTMEGSASACMTLRASLLALRDLLDSCRLGWAALVRPRGTRHWVACLAMSRSLRLAFFMRAVPMRSGGGPVKSMTRDSPPTWPPRKWTTSRATLSSRRRARNSAHRDGRRSQWPVA
ncbi:phage tail tape measure protein [Aeromicrobium sp. UC242_57]|uniref:phage tail tape measure protein n=1 Tax=Aeromicrobium sp. UC242_57 TaxID=3374624 RepID=UPI00378F1C4F